MKILIGSTIPAFKMTDDGHWHHWLENAEQIAAAANEAGHAVEWLAVLQVDARGLAPFAPLFDRLEQLEQDELCRWTVWKFMIDTGETEITGGSRLAAICTGRNLIIERALREGHKWIYFADADITAPDDILPKLLELDWPVCGGHVPTYGLTGPIRSHILDEGREVQLPENVREHWNTAGSLLIARKAFRRVPWRYDPDAGETDDPATQAELARLGWRTLVWHDVICKHNPECIGPVDQRGHDLAVYR